MRKLLFLCLSSIIAFSGTAYSEDRPNILFILIDDLGWMDMGYNGSTFRETPHLDQFSKDAMRFDSAYTASPMCSPTRVSIITGKNPARTGITQYLPGWYSKKFRTITPISTQYMSKDEYTVGMAFKDNGYNTAFIGKWHMGPLDFGGPEAHGFDTTAAIIEANRCEMFFPFRGVPYFPDAKEGDYFTDKLTDTAIDYLNEQKDTDQPFFMYLAHFAMHAPIEAKQELFEKYEKKRAQIKQVEDLKDPYSHKLLKAQQDDPHYAGELENLDENIGRVINALKENGQYENTIIVFTGDNGGRVSIWENQAHPTSNQPLRAGKTFVFEGGIKVPLIIHWPGVTQPGMTSDVPVNSADFYSTFLEMAGISERKQKNMDGVSIAPLLKGKTLDRDEMVWHFPHYQGEGAYPSSAIRQGPYKLIHNYHYDKDLLFNLETDPYEEHNLLSQQPDLAAAMKFRLLESLHAVSAKMPIRNPSKDLTEEIGHKNGINVKRPKPL